MHLRSQFLLASLLVALLATLPFLPGLPGQFVFDDIPNIQNNESIRLESLDVRGIAQVISTPQISGNMRGLPTLTFALDYWRGGGAEPGTFKTTNIVVHALTTFALAWLLRSVLLLAGTPAGRVRWLAPAMALAWAVHPLLVSSVLYAVQRLQTMATLFLVLALLAYTQARRAQMEGHPARTLLLGTALLWVLAMACKEDSVQLPVFTLALELTVLRFACASERAARLWRRLYLGGVLAGVAIYLLVIVPQHWNWDAYGGRDFSTPERLLTQARVLVMYLWQMVVPLPSHMPFYYDWLQPSRGLLHPWTTLASLLLLAGLLVLGVWQRRSRPLLALGIFLFFGAHFVTSNVIGLELAFEHRNHFALIGVVLAIGSLLVEAAGRLRLRLRLPPRAGAVAGIALLAMLGSAAALRAHDWRNNLALAQASAAAAPHSARAWILLCATHFRQGGGPTPQNTGLDAAIDACRKGAELAPYSLNNVALLVVLKTLRGDITPADWALAQQRLRTVLMSWDNERAPMILTHHWAEGVKLDKAQLLDTMDILLQRGSLKAANIAAAGYFVMDNMGEPDRAMPFFIQAIGKSPPTDLFPQQISKELREKGRADLAEKIMQVEQGHAAQLKSSGG